MGTLEAAGMQFDHVWISGMVAGNWPPPGNPSPLLSRALQQEFGLPDATPADTLLFSKRVLKRLTCCASTAVLSWPRSDGESELAASSMLDQMAHDIYCGAADPGWHALQFCGTDASVIVAEDPVPQVTADEVVTGGAYTVQRQRVEPFAAFVYGRLGIRRPEAIEPGIAPGVRGDIIHNALHTLLAERPTQAEIRDWGATNLVERLGSAIDSALAGHLRHADKTHTRLLGLERTRLTRLLRRFIAAETERPEFAVAEVEKSPRVRRHSVSGSDSGSTALTVSPMGRYWSSITRPACPKSCSTGMAIRWTCSWWCMPDALESAVGGLALINIDSRSISYQGTGGSVEWDAARPR